MSIETLIEAAEYVDKVETTVGDTESRTSNSQTMTSAKSNMKTSKDGTIQHWRKRAVAQSVMELKESMNVPKSEDIHEKKQAGSTASTNAMKLPTLEESVFKRSIPSASECDQKGVDNITDVVDKSSVSSSLQNGTGVVDSLPMAAMRCTTSFQPSPVSTVPLVHASVSFGSSAAQGTSSSGPAPDLSSPSASGHVSGPQAQSLPSYKIIPESRSPEISKKRNQLGAVTREAHNKLEKTRRAHLKGCFDMLRNTIPNLGAKVSNLVILQEALKYVQVLKEKNDLLEEERRDWVKQKDMKEQILKRLRQQLSNYLQPAEVDDVLKRVGQNGFSQSDRENFSAACSATGMAFPTISSIARTSRSSAYLSPVISEAPESFTANQATQVSTTSAPSSAQNRESGTVPSTVGNTINNVFPPLSSTMNLVWHNSNDIRRVCTMLPAPQMLTSTEIRKRTEEKVFTKTNVSSSAPSSLHHSPVTSLTHFKPIPVNSGKPTNAKSYTGWNLSAAEIPSFMEVPPSPLKIVVKSVDSAKQQARGAKFRASHQKVVKTISFGDFKCQKFPNQRSRQTELVFRPRSSITPPPPSNITPYFPRFSVGSGGSPPLTTVFPNMSDGSNQSNSEDYDQSDFTLWQSEAMRDYERSSDKNRNLSLKRASSAAISEASVSKTSKIQMPDSETCANISNVNPIASSNSSVSGISNETRSIPQNLIGNIPGPSMGFLVGKPSTLMPMAIGSLSSPVTSQSKSVTQVCFATLTSSKLPSPTSPSQLANTIVSTAVCETANFTLPTLPGFVVRNPVQSLLSSQHRLPATVMTPIMSHSSGQTIVGNVATPMPDHSLALESRPSSASSSDSQTLSSVKAAVPQVQYMIPMGYSGMMAGPNGATMAFPQGVGGFIPVMPPQAQGWGYIMPQNMMLAQNGSKSSVSLGTATISNIGETDLESEAAQPPVTTTAITNGGVFSHNKDFQPIIMAVQPSFVASDEKQGLPSRSPAPQQFQIASSSFQPSNQMMVPVAANQSGGFVFGGTPTMMASGQGGPVGYQMPMNIIGYPVQMSGSPSIRLAPIPQAPRGIDYSFAGGVQPGVVNGGNIGQARQGTSSCVSDAAVEGS